MRGLDREVSAQIARTECHAGRIKATLVDVVEMHVKVTRRVLTKLLIRCFIGIVLNFLQPTGFRVDSLEPDAENRLFVGGPYCMADK